ncbi:L,D-transpeptidase family protein [Altericroceibacterium spongiae]|uniref:L,D-transpeptidase family protein n=1 Tax=Altericroceibacterium spongiae TaxID=2320269 RepID=UPI001EE5E28B|nr:L,D-transpeptidase family protein [Altericroceibacterium spongiae]
MKWILGATLAVMCAIGAVFAAGQWFAEPDGPAQTAQADIQNSNDVLTASMTRPIGTTSETPSNPKPDPAPDTGRPFVIKRILPIEGPIKYGEWYWDDDGVPDGPLVMTVDLDARVLSVFRDGYEIGATAVLLGTQDHPTPLGTFPILEMKKENYSSIYDNAPMPYTMRLTWDGVSIHGSQVENGYASHGCIGAPNPFAAKLFALASKGDKVIITRGKMADIGDPLIIQ